MIDVLPDIAIGNPYLGLRPFEPKDAPFFFGREEQTYELLRRLDEHRFVAVLGLSGSGKSSLVRAGLIPLLSRGYLTEGGDRWRIATMRPGADPISQLHEALNKALEPDASRGDALRRSSFGLIHAARMGRSKEENLLVFVDQFEEIFRHERSTSNDFVRLLLTAAQEAQPDFRIYIVVTMRTDYLGDCAQFRDLPEALNDSQYLVPRLTPDQRRLAIVEPAKACGGQVDGELLQQLMLDAGDDPDQLPILQHLLMRMWTFANQDDGERRITLNEYSKAGGWKNAIDEHGKELLNPLPEHRRQIAKRIFQRVTELGGRERDRRRLTLLSELVAICASLGTEADVRAVVEHFRRPGSDFLTSPDWDESQDPLVDITHESLIRQWTELNKWAREESESGEWFRRIEVRLRTKGNYLAGPELDSALAARKGGNWSKSWAARYADVHAASNPSFEEVNQFLSESDRRQSDELKWHRLRQTLIAIAAIIFAILAATTGYFWWSAKTKAREARSRELAAYSVESLATDPELGVALGIQSVRATLDFRQAVLPVAQDTLHRAILASSVRITLRGHAGPVSSVAFSPDGKRLATASEDGTAKVWDASSGGELLTLRGHTGPVSSVAFSPDGKRLATASADRTAKVRDASSGGELLMLRGHTGPVWSVAFSPDGKRLATASADGTAKVWDASSGGELLTLRGHAGPVSSVAFSPDGKRLATASWDGTVQVYAIDIQTLLSLAKQRVTRPLTTEECKRYFSGETCPV